MVSKDYLCALYSGCYKWHLLGKGKGGCIKSSRLRIWSHMTQTVWLRISTVMRWENVHNKDKLGKGNKTSPWDCRIHKSEVWGFSIISLFPPLSPPTYANVCIYFLRKGGQSSVPLWPGPGKWFCFHSHMESTSSGHEIATQNKQSWVKYQSPKSQAALYSSSKAVRDQSWWWMHYSVMDAMPRPMESGFV